MKYIDRIRELLTGLANIAGPSKEDRLWNAWLDVSKKKEPCDLQALLTSDVRKEFKVRALTVLLAPDLKVLPFRWDDNNHSTPNYLSLAWLEVKAIPVELVGLAGELVCQNIDYAHDAKDEKVRESLFAYNNLILQFLSVLPENDDLAQRLFSRYLINDPIPYMTMEDTSGYNPLRKIFCAQNVPNKWKVLADKQMRARILDEVQGREEPREDWEVALRCYLDHIQTANYDGHEGYSRELLASQLRFVTELPGIESYDQELFGSWQVANIMEAIPGDDLRETRHKLARLVVLRQTEQPEEFSVWDSKSRHAADLMLREFGAEDQELSTKLTAMIAEADRRGAENALEQHAQEEKINRVLAQMK